MLVDRDDHLARRQIELARGREQAPDLDRVIIYKQNLEKICRDREELIEQIQVTVRHEIGHYLGLDENDLARLGLA